MKLPAPDLQEGLLVNDRPGGEDRPSGITLVPGNVPLVIDLAGALNVEILQRSIKRVIARHKVLHPPHAAPPEHAFSFDLQILDRRSDPAGQAGAAATGDDTGGREPDGGPGRSPSVKGYLMQLSQAHHRLVMGLPPGTVDKKSLYLITRELTKFYGAEVSGQKTEVADLPVPYAEVAERQAARSGQALEGSLGYWRKKLRGVVTTLELPVSGPRTRNFRAAVQSFTIHPDLAARATGTGRANGLSREVLLLAAFKVLLHKYTGQTEILLGTRASGRDVPGMERVVGPVDPLLALRSRITTASTFLQLAADIARTHAQGVQHKAVPFARIASELGIIPNAAQPDLLSVVFGCEEEKEETFEAGNVTFRMVETNLGWGAYDISLLIREAKGTFTGVLVYNACYFEPGFIARFAGHYVHLLESVLENPAVLIGKISLLTGREREQLVHDFNRTQRHYPPQTIQELFETQANQTPEAVAVVFEGRQLTYRQLNARANQLAHYLRERHGLVAEEAVGVLAERSELLIVALLGILKAGGAYLPIDPAYPAERRTYLMTDGRVRVLLTESARLPETRDYPGAVLPLDQLQQALEEYTTENPGPVTTPASLAYIIYTSGSTGRPKGVMVEHRNVIRLVSDPLIAAACAGKRLLQTGAIAFDASTFEIWGTLLHGGELHLLPHARLVEVGELKDKLLRARIDTIWLTSSWFNQLIALDAGLFEKLSCLLVGGEQLSPRSVNVIKSLYPDLHLINGYGPTESTTFAALYPIPEAGIAHIPIGRPIANTQLYVLDEQLQLVPIGVAGEICIGGAGVARGYLNQEALTRQKFVDNPFGAARLYRTGDLGRWREDGNLEYLGRKDEQVKLRGFRIELGEIEQVLLEHPWVDQAVVVLREDSQQSKYLAAFMVAAPAAPAGKALETEVVSNYLRGRLPAYMVPDCLVQLPALPLTGNGKVDRKALPDTRQPAEAE